MIIFLERMNEGKIEYKILRYYPEFLAKEIEDELNKLSAEGWAILKVVA